MYIPKHFEQPSIDAMHELMDANPFVTLIIFGPEGLCGNHLPMELHRKPQPYGTLVGHVARANPVWQLAGDKEVLVIFQASNAYITPSWYPSKTESGKVVPTWNYAVVHAHGKIRTISDSQWLKAHVENLTNHQESSFSHPWAVSDAPTEFTEKLLNSIVGIEIEITKLVGKWKVSQNRPESDRAGVVAGLRSLGANEMAELVEKG